MKADRKIYKGIEYIQLQELPAVQQEQLREAISPDTFIKILIDGKIVSQCLQYKDYSHWYDAVFSVKAEVRPMFSQESLPVGGDFALNKA